MKKDIEFYIAKEVYIAITHEWNEGFLGKDWNAYIINNRNTPIEVVIVVSKGYDEEVKTAKMRHAFPVIVAKSAEKLERIQEEVLRLNNQFDVTFFVDGKLYEKTFVFEKNQVNENNLVAIPILNKDGVIAR